MQRRCLRIETTFCCAADIRCVESLLLLLCVIAILEVLVLVLAASGILVGGGH